MLPEIIGIDLPNDGWICHGDDGSRVGDVLLDLSRVGASDILARRIAFALDIDWCDWSPFWDGRVWELKRDGHSFAVIPDVSPDGYGDEGVALCVPALATVPEFGEEFTRAISPWHPKMEAPSIRDLVALGILAKHLSAQEQA